MSSRQILTADEIRRTLVRISHEIVEKHGGADGLALVGIERRGVPLANRLADAIEGATGVRLPVGSLDITFYRDDLSRIDPAPRLKGQRLPFDPAQATVVIVDDVLYTGRTVRAVINELYDYGRPACVRLAVLVDRGGRELPFQADFAAARVALPADRLLSLARDEGGVFHFRIQEA